MRRIKKETYQRSFSLERGQVDEDRRTIEVSFSSAEPVERWWGREILEHTPGSVRLERLKKAGSLLVDHNPRDVVGVPEKVYIGTDGKGRALVRFGRSARAEEIFQDVLDGIRRTISVSYRVHNMVLEEEANDGLSTYRITDWEPSEISLVSIPADISVGVGRSSDEGSKITAKEKTMDTQNEFDKARKKGFDRGAEVERERIAEITAIARNLSRHVPGLEKLKDEYIREGHSTEEFRQLAVSRISSRPIETSPAHLGLSRGEVQEYSILRAINAYLEHDWRGAEFELECSRTVAEQTDRKVKGFAVPLDIPFAQQRTLTAGTTSTGAEMVATDHLGANFIDALRQELYVFNLGAWILPGLVGNVEIPSMGDATFYHVAEDVDITDSTPATAEVSLTPKTMGGAVPMSRRFLKQSAPAAEGVVRNLLVRGAAVELESKIINGSGAAAQPTGILNTTGLSTSTIATPGQPTWAELVEFETDVLTAKALAGSLAYLVTPAVQGYCKTTVKVSGDAGAGFLMQDGQINGYRAIPTTNMPTNGILFGNFRDVLVGMWGGMDIKPDEATKAAAGGLVVRIFLDYDVGLSHAVSFSKNA